MMSAPNPDEKSITDKLPADHPFIELARLHHKINSLEGCIELAKEGEIHAARRLLSDFYFMVQEKTAIPDKLNEYLASCFLRILKRECPDLALNLTIGKNQRPALTYRNKMDRLWLGWRVARAMETLSLEDASAKVAAEANVSPSTAEKAYKKYVKDLFPKDWKRLARAEQAFLTAKK